MDYLQYEDEIIDKSLNESFKPCYKWITFNILAIKPASVCTASF